MLKTVTTVLMIAGIAFGLSWLFIHWPEEPLELIFPEHISLGEIWLIENTDCFTCGNGEKDLGAAKGTRTITLPSSGDWYLELRMPQNATELMRYLDKDPSLTLLQSINLERSNIQDNDLQYISNFELRRINLKATRITGEGLSYLKPHPIWISVDISCNSMLGVDQLRHFSDWKQATVSVTGWCGAAENELSVEAKQQLIAKTTQAICPSGVLDDCVQIR